MTAQSNTDTIFIRRMQTEDLDKVQEIDRLSFTLPWPDSAYRFELEENPLSALWVAEDLSLEPPNRVIGVIVVWFIIDEAHIATLAVHPSYRGFGVAKCLLIKALKSALDKGMKLATLEVRANNHAAQALYRHFGFENVGQRRRYYRDNNEDAIIMTLNHLENSIILITEKCGPEV